MGHAQIYVFSCPVYYFNKSIEIKHIIFSSTKFSTDYTIQPVYNVYNFNMIWTYKSSHTTAAQKPNTSQ